MSRLMNHTPFSAAVISVFDNYPRRYDVVLVSATFVAAANGGMTVSEEQLPVPDADVWFGEPGRSSVRYEGESAWHKRFVDVLINGRAIAPRGRRAQRLHVSLRVGAIRKELIVSGDRYWKRGVTGRTPSAPEPFDAMDLRYERAFGGVDTRRPAKLRLDRRNLVGVGFRGSTASGLNTELPNIEYPGQLVSSPRNLPEPAGFGIVSRDWLPRLTYAGTYDSAWIEKRCPLLPRDFDTRYFQVTPPDQQCSSLRAGEAVEVVNMSPDGSWRFSIPPLEIPLRLVFRDRRQTGILRVDTLLIEPDFRRITMIARAGILAVRNRAPLEEVILGRVRPGWWRAQVVGKNYLDMAGGSPPTSGVAG